MVPRARRLLVALQVNEFMGSVFLDTTAGVPASERFKMAFENVTDRQVYVATSPDGFAWTPVGQPAITVPGFAGACQA